MTDLTIHGFETSNNMKVRVALGYKRIDYTFRRIDPAADRPSIVALSGQHLTPVLVHGAVVLFDSAAILRYLDANFRDTPRLFGQTQAEQWAIEDEEFFARVTLAGPAMQVIHARLAGDPLPAERVAECGEAMARAIDALAAKLDGREWLVGDAMTAADITAGCALWRFSRAGLFAMPPSLSALEPWMERVMAHDAHLQRG